MEVIKDLLRIKQFREQQAERALVKARVKLAEASENLKRAKEAVENFKKESIQKEKSMYVDLCSRLVILKEIENVRLDVDLMKEKSIELEKQVEEADKQRSNCIEHEATAFAMYIEAVKAREKFDELKKSMAEESDALQMHAEELEMEEAAGIRFHFRGD